MFMRRFLRTWSIKLRLSLKTSSSPCLRLAVYSNPRSTLRNCSTTSITEVKSKEQELILNRANVLCRVLECEEEEAREMVKNNVYLLVKDTRTIEKRAKFVRSYFSLEDVIQHSQILTLPLGPIKEQYFTLTEFGIENISCSTLLDFRNVIRQTPEQLIDHGLMDKDSDPLQKALLVLNSPDFSRIAVHEFHTQRYMQNPVLTLKRSLLPRYLAHTFSSSIDQARLIIRLHYKLSGRCFAHIKECLTILQEVFQFPIEKIRVNPYLLEQEPSNLYKIAALPSLMAGNTLEMANKFPKVISQPVENLLQIETILREKGVKDEDLQTSRYLFTLSPETVRDLIIKRKLKRMLGR